MAQAISLTHQRPMSVAGGRGERRSAACTHLLLYSALLFSALAPSGRLYALQLVRDTITVI